MKEKEKKRKYSLYLAEKLMDQVAAVADKHDRSINYVASQAIQNGLKSIFLGYK